MFSNFMSAYAIPMDSIVWQISETLLMVLYFRSEDATASH